MFGPLPEARLIGMLLVLCGTPAEAKPEAVPADARTDTESEEIRLRRTLESAQGDARAEILLGLAGLLYDGRQALDRDEAQEWQARWDACVAPACDRSALPPKDASAGSVWTSESVAMYRQILTEHPGFSRADEAEFQLGSMLLATGDATGGLEALTHLVKTRPQSRFLPDAYFQIGEYYFANNSALKALTAYQHATQFPDRPTFVFAAYKLAWCYYILGDYDKAIEQMKRVALTQSADDPLRETAWGDLGRFFADMVEIDAAVAFFEQNGRPDQIPPTLDRLARNYVEMGVFEPAIEVYRRLIDLDPLAPDVPRYQGEIVKGYQRKGKAKQAFAELQVLRVIMSPDSPWARANAGKPATEARASAEEILRNLPRK